jgi:hypothetical protein
MLARAAEEIKEDVRVGRQAVAGGGGAKLERLRPSQAKHDVPRSIDAELELASARETKQDELAPSRYARVELLVLDELAYVPLTPAEAELLFQVLDERAELRSIVLTTNLPFGEWTKVFPEPRLCKAVVDRLTFNAHIVDTGTESWRLRKTVERRKAGRMTA